MVIDSFIDSASLDHARISLSWLKYRQIEKRGRYPNLESLKVPRDIGADN